VDAPSGVLANDNDPEGDTLTAALASAPSNGTLTLNSDGSFIYEHDGSETTDDSFTYQADDGNGGTDAATVSITVGGTRVTTGQQVLYTFEEGSGTTVYDVSGVGTPLDLTVQDSAAISWISGGGLAVNASTMIASAGAATKVIDAAKANDEITLEAWVKPANTIQDGPARIVTLSQDLYNRNFTLGQGLWGTQSSALYDVRLRTTGTSDNGQPSLTSPDGSLTTDLTHVVYTRDASGAATIYIDGVQRASRTVDGDFSNWDESYRLALANELTGDRTWLGEFYLVAIYDRALSQAEVSQNFEAGPDDTVPPTATHTPTSGRSLLSGRAN
jgi:VCBS repeat-containing protein